MMTERRKVDESDENFPPRDDNKTNKKQEPVI